jgi:hypothetical protein
MNEQREYSVEDLGHEWFGQFMDVAGNEARKLAGKMLGSYLMAHADLSTFFRDLEDIRPRYAEMFRQHGLVKEDADSLGLIVANLVADRASEMASRVTDGGAA